MSAQKDAERDIRILLKAQKPEMLKVDDSSATSSVQSDIDVIITLLKLSSTAVAVKKLSDLLGL